MFGDDSFPTTGVSALTAPRASFAPHPRPERLAEFVHHLGDVSLPKARRAVLSANPSNGTIDPLSIVASALVQLRREAADRQRIGA